MARKTVAASAPDPIEGGVYASDNPDPFEDAVLYASEHWAPPPPEFSATIMKHLAKLQEHGSVSVAIGDWDPTKVGKYITEIKAAVKHYEPGRRMQIRQGTIGQTGIPALKVTLFAASAPKDDTE